MLWTTNRFALHGWRTRRRSRPRSRRRRCRRRAEKVQDRDRRIESARCRRFATLAGRQVCSILPIVSIEAGLNARYARRRIGDPGSPANHGAGVSGSVPRVRVAGLTRVTRAPATALVAHRAHHGDRRTRDAIARGSGTLPTIATTLREQSPVDSSCKLRCSIARWGRRCSRLTASNVTLLTATDLMTAAPLPRDTPQARPRDATCGTSRAPRHTSPCPSRRTANPPRSDRRPVGSA